MTTPRCDYVRRQVEGRFFGEALYFGARFFSTNSFAAPSRLGFRPAFFASSRAEASSLPSPSTWWMNHIAPTRFEDAQWTKTGRLAESPRIFSKRRCSA